MVWIWRFILGYLKIEVIGENVEQILNLAAANKINLWNLKYVKGKIYGNILIKNYIKLFKIRRGVAIRHKILKKCGLIFIFKKHNHRIGMILGVLIYTIILFILSNFIWIINVEGISNIPKNQIIKSCKKIGIYEGINKKNINCKYDAQRLQLVQKNIAWCSFTIEGCVLSVNISETENSDNNDKKYPSNIKAKTDGKIKKINVSKGNVLVKVGDTVSKGDILVSGIIDNMTSNVFVHSQGEIIAETKREFSAQGNYVQQINIENQNVIKHYTLKFFNIKIPLFLDKVKDDYNYYFKIYELKFLDNKLPIKLALEKYHLTEKIDIKYEENMLEEILYKDIVNQTKKYNFINCNEIKREIIKTNKGILLKITYICEENIAVQNTILLGKEN